MLPRSVHNLVIVPGVVAAATMLLLLTIVPPARSLSWLEVSGGLIAVFIVGSAVQWALERPGEPDSGDAMSHVEDLDVQLSDADPVFSWAQNTQPRDAVALAKTESIPMSESGSDRSTMARDYEPTYNRAAKASIAEVRSLEAAPSPIAFPEFPEIAIDVDVSVESRRFHVQSASAASQTRTETLSPKLDTEWRWQPWRDEPRDTAVLTWIGKGETIDVGPFTLSDPFIYVCDGKGSLEESSCIDRRRHVGTPTAETVERLPYSPEYATISSNQRANYLQWLAGRRCGPLSEIGYAFLFFYGLERRLLIEGMDLSPIVKEVVRLLETYTFSGSFDSYLSRFLSYSLARTGIGTLKEKWFHSVFERTRAQRDELHLAVGLAWLVTNARPLPANWALRIARLDPRAPSSVILERLPERFNELFTKRYRERYGDGMALAAANREKLLNYTPANPSFLTRHDAFALSRKPVPIPDVMAIQSQFTPIVSIWTSCIEELKPLSRVMAKGVEVSTRLAYEALPDDLKTATEHPDSVDWQRVVAERADTNADVVVTVGSLAQIQGFDDRARLTIKQSEALAQTANSIGFVIEPDPRITKWAYRWTDRVALFRPEGRPSLPTGAEYAAAAVMLELGMFIAAADEKIDKDEVDHIASFLESQFLLDPRDARRLEALKSLLMVQPPSITGTGKRLKAILNEFELESIGQFLFGVAAASGSVEKSEIAALRSAYRALGIDPKSLDGLLVEHVRALKEPVEVRVTEAPIRDGESIPQPAIIPPAADWSPTAVAGTSEALPDQPVFPPPVLPLQVQPPAGRSGTGERISQLETTEIITTCEHERTKRVSAPRNEPSPTPPKRALFQLNRSVIERLMHETKQVTDLLDAAMHDEDECPEDASAEAIVPAVSSLMVDARFDGLDQRYCALLGTLCDRPSWTCAEFEELVRRHSLMTAGTLDRINDWAYDKFDDPILESDGDVLIVHAKLLLERA